MARDSAVTAVQEGSTLLQHYAAAGSVRYLKVWPHIWQVCIVLRNVAQLLLEESADVRVDA